MAKESKINHLAQDFAIVILSIFVALFIVESGIMRNILSASSAHWLESFIAGIFFTSVFTTAPAIVVLAEIAANDAILVTAFWGALGALAGDFLIFHFVRDRLAEDLMDFIKKGHPRLKAIARSRAYKRFLPFLGALIIASPFPDELGLIMLGASHIEPKKFVVISFVFNFLGILAIALVSRALI